MTFLNPQYLLLSIFAERSLINLFSSAKYKGAMLPPQWSSLFTYSVKKSSYFSFGFVPLSFTANIKKAKR